MASLSDIVIRKELRPCICTDNHHSQRMLFHTWLTYDKTVCAVVEDKDGNVLLAEFDCVRFVDNAFADYVFPGEGGEDEQ